MFLETVQFLIKTIADLFVLVLLLRFYLQVARAPFKHPLCQFVMAATNFAVLPLRKLVPSIHGYDSATLQRRGFFNTFAQAFALSCAADECQSKNRGCLKTFTKSTDLISVCYQQ
jgi:uncharacterized protein YggT (Ycf19 family)